ncbi:MAG: acyl-CoA thioesterase [Desulfobacteraceae bacterium]|jgi:acyl-CoA thioester hydrolase|nr:acyl-CoA thioesterase [Desulfobacteraceae bacterium]MDH3572129.1 acyl-CoA thioesterase [Desulfobacteraceae bacterium]MDH3720444.1 acyl-CoA thioesterase [Desulfobacteraceae bacterium]MDH3835142.1 acyl-CoA thioesterase [Desulfobacteraceae bacterium]MDH3874741.1 acyl-CoA thioesterase [Desulfobacteraceae bacterium]
MAKSDFNFFSPFRVRYAETDAQGIVFYAHYLTYFDTAINEYLRYLPFNYIEHVRNTGTDFHVIKVVVEFFAPSHFDDEIEVYVRTARIGRSSMTFLIEIFPKNGETALVKGEVVWVNTDQKAHKSVPLPEELVVKLRVKEDRI